MPDDDDRSPRLRRMWCKRTRDQHELHAHQPVLRMAYFAPQGPARDSCGRLALSGVLEKVQSRLGKQEGRHTAPREVTPAGVEWIAFRRVTEPGVWARPRAAQERVKMTCAPQKLRIGHRGGKGPADGKAYWVGGERPPRTGLAVSSRDVAARPGAAWRSPTPSSRGPLAHFRSLSPWLLPMRLRNLVELAP